MFFFQCIHPVGSVFNTAGSADAGIEPRIVAVYALTVRAAIDHRATSKPQYYMLKSFNRPAGLTGQKKVHKKDIACLLQIFANCSHEDMLMYRLLWNTKILKSKKSSFKNFVFCKFKPLGG